MFNLLKPRRSGLSDMERAILYPDTSPDFIATAHLYRFTLTGRQARRACTDIAHVAYGLSPTTDSGDSMWEQLGFELRRGNAHRGLQPEYLAWQAHQADLDDTLYLSVFFLDSFARDKAGEVDKTLPQRRVFITLRKDPESSMLLGSCGTAHNPVMELGTTLATHMGYPESYIAGAWQGWELLEGLPTFLPMDTCLSVEVRIPEIRSETVLTSAPLDVSAFDDTAVSTPPKAAAWTEDGSSPLYWSGVIEWRHTPHWFSRRPRTPQWYRDETLDKKLCLTPRTDPSASTDTDAPADGSAIPAAPVIPPFTQGDQGALF